MTDPRLNSVLVERCLTNGALTEDGTYAYVSFNWETDESVSSITFKWKGETDADWNTNTISASGTSGSVEQVCCSGKLSAECRYTFIITITTASTETIVPGVLKSTPYLIDKKSNGLGIGRTAELDDVVDIEFQTRFLGGLLQPVLTFGTDLNNVIIPNTYTGASAATQKYKNCPLGSGTFILKVEAAGNGGQIMQTIISCHKYASRTYIRFYYSNGWGEWMKTSTAEVTLFENDSGAAGNVTLSYPASEFEYIEIHYTDNNGRGCGYAKVRNANGKYVHLALQEAAATTVFLRQTVYTISGTTMTPNVDAASIVRITTENGAVPTMGTNYIRIVRVVGRA